MWKDFPDARAIYYVDGKPAPVGTRLKNPAYAAILRDIAARGPDAFYSGANAKAISDAVANAPRNAAELTVKDLAAYQAKERPKSEEHTSELQSIKRISFAVFCLKKKKNILTQTKKHTQTD